MTHVFAVLAVALPAAAALFGFLLGRDRSGARDWAVLGTGAALVAAVAELVSVLRTGPVTGIAFLGRLDTGYGTGSGDTGVVSLALRADELSATLAVAAGLVAFCVQVYSAAYLHGDGTPDAPTRYRPYAATVTLFTAAMMLVVHADDLLLLLVGWEVMGLASYLLVGHHSERDAARRAAVKAFLVTRVGDLGVLLAVVVLLVDGGTTSVRRLVRLVGEGEISGATLTVAALLLLAGVAGKSAQFPLHTWLPDAMEGPTPVSALIHAATMVAAGVFLVARLLPVFLAAEAALAVAAVIASVTMLGAALAALAQDDLKRLLAWSTISQVAFMLAGVVVDPDAGSAPGVFHLLAHAGFKALLFLVAGCVAHLAGSTLLADMGGLRRARPGLALLLALGLGALAGLPPLSGFWSKESVLTAAEHAAVEGGSWTGWTVLVSGLLTTVVTGVYAGRAWAVVAGGDPVPGFGAEHVLPRAMTWPLLVHAVPTAGLGLVLLDPPAALDAPVAPLTALTGGLLSVVGVAWALTAPRLGTRDVAAAMPPGVRAFLRDGYRLDAVQDRLVVRPVLALARASVVGDRDVVDAYVRGTPVATRWAGVALRRAQTGLATGYVAWLVAGALLAGLAGVVLT